MQVGQQDVQLATRLAHQLHAERPHPRSGMQHEGLTALEMHRDARRVAAVADGVGAWCCKRTSATPHPRVHQCPSAGQNTVTTPCISCAAAKSGYAVAST